MRYVVIVLTFITVILGSGCSDDEDDKTVELEPPTPVIAMDPPLGIMGYPFEGGGKCAIDVVNNRKPEEIITVGRADGMSIEGWAFDDRKNSVPPVAALQLVNGKDYYYVLVNRRGGREDLATAFGRSEFSNAGYVGSFDIAGLPVGQYDILVIQRGKKANLVCPTYHKLVLSD